MALLATLIGSSPLLWPSEHLLTKPSELAQQNRDKHDPTLDGLDFIGANEYRLNLTKQLAAGKEGESSRGSDSFFASRGGYTRKRGGSPLCGGRGGGHIGYIIRLSSFLSI